MAELVIPSVIIKPTTEQLQTGLNQIVRTIVNTSKKILRWSEFGKKVSRTMKNRIFSFNVFFIIKVNIDVTLNSSIDTTTAENESIISGQPAAVEAEDEINISNAEQNLLNPNLDSSNLSENNAGRPRGNTLTTIAEAIQQTPQAASLQNQAMLRKTYFKYISENKEINKIISQLNTSVITLRNVIRIEIVISQPVSIIFSF